jgi:tRNA nucleotidyltransferase (CCA-adding enzyme)
VVGGAVRDELLGLPPSDYDICTDATVGEIEDVFSNFALTKIGARFGTVCVAAGGASLEITTYRSDGEYLDSRRPESVVFCRSLKEDLARRDFTVNAMAYNPGSGYIDYFGGRRDLRARLIRCVGEPERRFGEDALRIMRALRLAAKLGFSLEDKTGLTMKAMRAGLRRISAERLRDELSGFIISAGSGSLLLRYREIFFEFIPELAPCDGFLQHNPNHDRDVLGHIAETVDRCGGSLTLKLAALLHDVGKPLCFVMERGRGRFPGHMEASAEIARRVLKRLRYPKKLVDDVCALVENHDKPYLGTPESARDWLGRLGRKNLFALIKLKRADCLAHAPCYHDRLRRIAGFRRAVVMALKRRDCYSLARLSVNGRDVNAALGLKPGRYTGEILKYLLRMVIDGKAENRREALLSLAREYRAEGRDSPP